MAHACLEHVNHSIISLLNNKRQIYLTSILHNRSFCSTCQLAKSYKLLFLSKSNRSNVILGLVHCDI
jgi:hypothetical protein